MTVTTKTPIIAKLNANDDRTISTRTQKNMVGVNGKGRNHPSLSYRPSFPTSQKKAGTNFSGMRETSTKSQEKPIYSKGIQQVLSLPNCLPSKALKNTEKKQSSN